VLTLKDNDESTSFLALDSSRSSWKNTQIPIVLQSVIDDEEQVQGATMVLEVKLFELVLMVCTWKEKIKLVQIKKGLTSSHKTEKFRG
jgi:hypothetical protein